MSLPSTSCAGVLLKYWNIHPLQNVPGQKKHLPKRNLKCTCSSNNIVSVHFLFTCRIWELLVRRSGLATTSCLLWKRWISTSFHTTTCESDLEHCSQTRASTLWTSRISKNCHGPVWHGTISLLYFFLLLYFKWSIFQRHLVFEKLRDF